MRFVIWAWRKSCSFTQPQSSSGGPYFLLATGRPLVLKKAADSGKSSDAKRYLPTEVLCRTVTSYRALILGTLYSVVLRLGPSFHTLQKERNVFNFSSKRSRVFDFNLVRRSNCTLLLFLLLLFIILFFNAVAMIMHFIYIENNWKHALFFFVFAFWDCTECCNINSTEKEWSVKNRSTQMYCLNYILLLHYILNNLNKLTN